MPDARRPSATALLLLVCLTTLSAGCVRRRMLVRTNPPGALVSIDNQQIGISPAATSFTYYGTREIRVEKDGFNTETLRHRVTAPWYQWIGIDFIAETLWPSEIRDERVIDVTLTPQTIPRTDEVIRRAEDLRSQAQAGVVTPLPTAATTVAPPPGIQPMTLPGEGVPFGN